MYLQQIRNATIFLYYGGKTFLIDPILAPKGSWPPRVIKALLITYIELNQNLTHFANREQK